MKKTIGLATLSLCLIGCNPYSVVDKPSGDAQVLVAARACFDQGDYECANKYYGQLSNSASDEIVGEMIFGSLAQNGAPVGAFISSAIDGASSGGKLVTKLSDNLTATPGETSRLALLHTYQRNTQITDTRLKGLVQFVTGMAVAAELLSEYAATRGALKQTDFVSSPTTCTATLALQSTDPTLFATRVAAGTSGCEIPAGRTASTGTSIASLDAITTDAQFSGTATLYMITAAIQSINTGLDRVKSSGSIGSSSNSFATTVLAAALTGGAGDSPLFRGTLITQAVGASE